MDAVAEPLLARLRAADWKAREAIKDELLAAMRAFSDRDSAIRCLEEARKTLDLERRWDVDEVIEALTPAPDAEPEEEAPAEEESWRDSDEGFEDLEIPTFIRRQMD